MPGSSLKVSDTRKSWENEFAKIERNSPNEQFEQNDVEATTDENTAHRQHSFSIHFYFATDKRYRKFSSPDGILKYFSYIELSNRVVSRPSC